MRVAPKSLILEVLTVSMLLLGSYPAGSFASSASAGTTQVPDCPTCQQCRDNASETQEQCTNIDQQLTACQTAMASAAAKIEQSGSESQLGLQKEAFTTAATCLADVESRIAQCREVVGKCESDCSNATAWLGSQYSTGLVGAREVQISTEMGAVNSLKPTCQAGEAAIAQLEAAEVQLVAQNAQLIEAIALLAPTLLEMIMSGLGSTGGDVCAILKRDLGEKHASTEAACGPKFDPTAQGDNDGEESGDTNFVGPGGDGGDATFGLSPHNQEFDGVNSDRRQSSSKVREQSIQAASSGGGPMMNNSGSSSSSGASSRYEGAPGARGFNTNIMGDPEGRAGAPRRGTASGPNQQSQWLQGQQASARSKAEAHRRAAENAAQRKRELRGPHAQGLFESVSETYRRYQHEMMQ